MRFLVPAKINLHLRVGPPRADGFHPLSTWMCTVGLFDILDVTVRAAPGAAMRCDDPSLPVDDGNLVIRAAQALFKSFAMRGMPVILGVEIFLQKHIPHGAGLGGGSSDAATTLLAIDRVLGLNTPIDTLERVAADVGSDVPFFLHAPSAVCTGRGEIVRQVTAPKARWGMMVFPGTVMPTAAVYRRFDELGLGDESGSGDEPRWRDWAGLSAEQLLSKLENNLEPAAFSIDPKLGELRQSIENQLGRMVRMTGSGSSLFTLFDDKPAAVDAAGRIEREYGVRTAAVRIAPEIPGNLNAMNIVM